MYYNTPFQQSSGQPPPRKMISNSQDNDPQNNKPRDKNFSGKSHRDPAWHRDRNMRGKKNTPKDKNRSNSHEPDKQS
ncbi:hypothetical protein CMUS01_14140 [Colletotrichum musicola]|uniref:Uncharacterized protein n=1 Tax=Colletotrichum musicola TaxID=2175873 RepID=A0A8H6MTA9_9PEZI|nr:hypothetical protein CMUS01_14140 [Colletotrichum musicola]